MPPNPTILAFDTSAAHCAAALLSEGQIVTRIDEMARGQAEHLMPMLEEMLHSANLTWRDLDAIGVGIGPGNFTGIRISVSAARGLALGLKKPAIGVSSLEAQVFGFDAPVLSCLDARRDRAYLQILNAGSGDLQPTLVELTDENLTLPTQSTAPMIVGGMSEQIGTRTGWSIAEPKMHLIEGILHIAQNRMGDPVTRPAPLYLRPADAAPPRDLPPTVVP